MIPLGGREWKSLEIFFDEEEPSHVMNVHTSFSFPPTLSAR
jgi:hypothetical protein